MVYTAKHTSRTNNKNASKVVSGVLLTTSVLAGMAMAQDNNASADTIDTPTTTQQAQPVAQNQSKTQSDVQDQAQSTQEQSATSEVKTVASDSSTPVQKTAATTQDSTVVKEDVQADENTTKVTSAEDQAPKEDVTNETKAAQPKQSVTPQKKVGSDVKEKITTKVKGSEETNDPVDWSYDTWKLSDAEDYANYVIKWAGTQYEDQSAIRELQSKLNDVDAYWNGDEDYDDDTQKAITDKLAQDLQNLSASIYSNLEHSNIPNPQQAPINSKELQGVLDYANEIKAWAKNADFSDSVLNDPQSKLSGLYFAYYRTFTDLNGPMTTNYWYVMHFANDPYDTSSSQDEVNNYKDGLLSQLNELISMLEDNNIPKPDNNSGSDDNKGNNDNNSGSDDNKGNNDNNSGSDDNKGNNDNNSGSDDNKGNSDNNSDSDDNNGNNDNNSGSNDNKGNNDSNSSSDTNKGSSDNHQNSGNANNSSKDNSNSSNGIAQNNNHGNSNSGSNATGSSNAGSTESTKTTQNGSESLKNVSVTTPAEVAKKAQMSTSSSNQSESKTLPQTGDKSQTSSVWAGIVGIIIAGFGFLGFSKRKHG
ncbi:LPXTG cell wall anchor domain-containing protein [Pediococcus pentosaceus]|jgi:LPXTG-motif cell wall-anchored protein|uniref:LPXTG cell wall anchor domain-containing protein n=1 Tax=Pediococcus pentosaceus TaxID=1255 RepID=UPI00265B6CFF|nr:LPXTG cell wall anchor domain-containing protein [Pediococcus pentosaceus]WKF71447.1 LPXTG cell wall anchor domain-containing protein [Pediococcus pentosaceus]